MQEIRIVKMDHFEVPVLISDEKEALLAAQAAGRALVGLWRQGQPMEALAGVRYVVEDLADATDEYLERVARRHLGLPWKICETERLRIREMTERDFELVCANRVGPGLETVEQLRSYVKHQYDFYEFGFWALVEKATGKLVGVAGLLVPEDRVSVGAAAEDMILLHTGTAGGISEPLELGYHIFPGNRRCGLACEACDAILEYGREYLGVDQFVVRIRKDNEASLRVAGKLGFAALNG